ncbi:MAG: Lrp/AsnC family transcriptional regulator [Candidatus Velthaea sp.]|jgi:Lrp/AsnC family leucine-responsive transcriptional regulator
MIAHSELDQLDLQLVEALQRNARSTFAELGTIVGLKAPAVHERVKRLENRGYLRGYAAQVDNRRLGYELMAFVGVVTAPEKTYDEFTTQIATLPEVLEMHSVAGDQTFLLKVATRSTGHLDDLLSRIKRIPGIARTQTTIVLSTPFERPGVVVVDRALLPA